MHNFDPLTIPLKGQQLLEASAGTGKTYSIAQLYLRFILEDGLDVDEILVVTFTTSATEELRQRIRLRLRDALDALVEAGDGEIIVQDQILRRLLSELQNRGEAVQLLTDAIARMDESAVFTIHSFCQRMLQDHAFESGSAFDTEFIESEHQLRLEIIQDFWRQRFYSAQENETAWATAAFSGPQGVVKIMGPVLAQSEVACVPEVTDEEVNTLREVNQGCFQAVLESWRDGFEDIVTILNEDSALKRNERAYRADKVQIILAGTEKLVSMETAPWLLPARTELLAASVMADNIKKNKEVPEHPFFSLFDTFYQANMELTNLARIHVLFAAYQFMMAELYRRKQEHSQMYFDDLLARLDEAIAGPEGMGLVQRIRERYKVALVDEFQDTDPVQYRIFHSLFGTGPDPGLFMIGDPKQSIYSFRGADVFAYIKAKKDTLERSSAFTMDTNYRSTAAMVTAVNKLFDRQNSFVLGEDIAFSAVRSGSNIGEEPLVVEGSVPQPLQAMFLQVDSLAAERKNDISKERAEKAASSWTAQEIARLLTLGNMGEAHIGQQQLAGGDLAVLVRTHREADMIQRELAKLRIASVYYSHDSVFSTDEARELFQVLTALLDLSQVPRVNTALATPLFGMDAHDLEQLISDPARWDEIIARLEEYHLLWRSQGIAPMLQKLFGRQEVVQRLVDVQGGERKLTNYLHLAELLQEASGKQLGMDGLVRWFSNERNDPEETNARQQLRLESDENLVRIVTVHKAKGLEYPIVFLPFIWSCRQVTGKDIYPFHLPPDMVQTFDIGSGDDEYLEFAERERLAEDLRLLYVAVTRARYCCYFSWGRINKMEKSAMSWLLHRESPESKPVFADLSEERIVHDMESLNAGETVLEFLPRPADEREQTPVTRGTEPVLAPKVFRGHVDTGWTISSYSRMVRSAVHINRAAEVEPEQPYPLFDPSGHGVFSFPRGAEAGTCLHGVLEDLNFTGFTNDYLEERVHEHLRVNGLDTAWSRMVCGWIKDILNTPLDKEARLRLNGLGEHDRLVELGFYFTMDRFDPVSLDKVLKDFGFNPLEIKEELAGLMRGYIDLVFRFKGKYYLADYKSNYLGSSITDYQPSGLPAAIEEHRYDLQYLIYSVALHRYLATRIRGYDFDSHFGGVYYLFLRGMHPDHSPGNGIFYTLPSRELIGRLDNCFGKTGEQ